MDSWDQLKPLPKEGIEEGKFIVEKPLSEIKKTKKTFLH